MEHHNEYNDYNNNEYNDNEYNDNEYNDNETKQNKNINININIFDSIDNINKLNKINDSQTFATNYINVKQEITQIDADLSVDLTAQYENYNIQELFNLIETKYNNINSSNSDYLEPIELNKYLTIIKILESKLQNETMNWNEIE
jgi:hypothetical protein